MNPNHFLNRHQVTRVRWLPSPGFPRLLAAARLVLLALVGLVCPSWSAKADTPAAGSALRVELPDGTALASGSSLDWGLNALGATASRTVILRNVGSAALMLDGVALTGPDRDLFSLNTLLATPTRLEINQTLSLGLRFRPVRLGAHSASLLIYSNDSSQPVWSLSLPATAVQLPTSDDAALAALSGYLSPAFHPDITRYTEVRPYAVPGGNRTAVPRDPGATLSVDGVRVSPNSPWTIPSLQAGESRRTEIVVTAPAGNRRVYEIVSSLGSVQPGTYDESFHSPYFSAVKLAVPLPDEDLLFFGSSFQRISGIDFLTKRFEVTFNGTVHAGAQDAQGRFLVAGTFSTATYQIRSGNPGGSNTVQQVVVPVTNGLVRVQEDGQVDPLFKPRFDAPVRAIAVYPDGRMLIGGEFSTVNGQPRAHLVRLLASGEVDSGFSAVLNGAVRDVVFAADDSLWVGGSFTAVQGSPCQRLARLLPDGSLHPAYADPGLVGGEVNVLLPLAGGDCLAGGSFLTVAGNFHPNLARLSPEGTLVGSFAPRPLGQVNALCQQADGRILVGGAFTAVDGLEARTHLFRCEADGTLDAGFHSLRLIAFFLDQAVIQGLRQDERGRVLVAGEFSVPNPIDEDFPLASDVLRLGNDPVWSSAEVTDARTATWLRGQASPEALRVEMDLSTDGGTTRQPLGAATRIPGGWSRDDLTLPPSGQIRFVAFTSPRDLSGRMEMRVPFGRPAQPNLVVALGGVDLTPGNSAIVQPSVGLGPALQNLELRNEGESPLRVLEVTPGGNHPEDFQLTLPSLPLLLQPGAIVRLPLAFRPGGTGLRRGSFTISSDDPDAPARVIQLEGSGEPFTESRLLALTAVEGTLAPAFAPDQTQYSLSLPHFAHSLRLRAWPLNAAAQLTLNGVPLPAGQTSPEVPLPVGVSTQLVRAVAQDGVGLTEYQVIVTRAPASPGLADPAWRPTVNGRLNGLLPLPDGGILLYGSFSSVNGVTRYNVARLLPDGTVDPGFQPNPLQEVFAALQLPDGRVVIGGTFTQIGGNFWNRLARLNPNGSLDPSFNPSPSGTVIALALEADGSILVGGDFASIAGLPLGELARIRSDGSLDPAFAPNTLQRVTSILVQPDGRILVGGYPVGGAGTPAQLARLEPDGSIDPNFAPVVLGTVYTLASLPDQSILVGGSFTAVGGVPRNSLAKLTPDGQLDAGFDANVVGTVRTLGVQTSGRIVVGGTFTSVGGQGRNNVARLLPSGAVDSEFNPDVSGPVHSAFTDGSGRVLVGGAFSSVSGGAIANVARLLPEPVLSSLEVESLHPPRWLRSGSLPETQRVYFQYSTNGGHSFSTPVEAVRVGGHWEAPDLLLPAIGRLRASALLNGGLGNGGQTWLRDEISFSGIASAHLRLETLDAAVFANNQVHYMGAVAPGAATNLTWVIRNTGSAPLGRLLVRLEDLHAPPTNPLYLPLETQPVNPFSVLSQPTPSQIPAGGTATFTLRFAPTTGGGHRAALLVCSDDPEQAEFRVELRDTDAPSANTGLAGLSLLGEDGMNRAVVPQDNAYQVSVPHAAASAQLFAFPSDPEASWVISAYPAGPGVALPLAVGTNSFTLVVTAADGVSSATNQLFVVRSASADGSLLSTLPASVEGSVAVLAADAQGRWLVGGSFTRVGGVALQNLARLHADGTLDTTFQPNPNGEVAALAVQRDGKLLIGGVFSTVHGVPRERLARLLPDGTLDPAFAPPCNGRVGCLALQGDESILVGGAFTTLGGQMRNYVGRLHPDGALDDAFNPNANSIVHTMSVQSDGHILMGGEFGRVGGFVRSGLVRLTPQGTLDTSFILGFSGKAYDTAILPDGRILVAGSFKGSHITDQHYLLQLNTNGTRVSTYQPGPNRLVYRLLLDRDGQTWIGGDFTVLKGVPRGYFARLRADGTPETSVTTQMDESVTALAAHGGRLLVAGHFQRVDGFPRTKLALLQDDFSAGELVLTAPNRLDWILPANAPEASVVGFDQLLPVPRPLGLATRTSTGWTASGFTLPSHGTVRAYAYLPSGGSGSGLYSQNFEISGLAAPALQVDAPGQPNLSSGDTVAFGAVAPGGSTDITLTLRNVGATNLDGFAHTLAGLDGDGFTVVSAPAPSVAPGDSTALTLRFSPTRAGGHHATLRLESNDPHRAPLVLNLIDTSAPSSQTDLAGLLISPGTLSPVFAPSQHHYTVQVSYYESPFRLAAQARDPDAALLLDGAPWDGIELSRNLVPGPQTFQLVVVAADGQTRATNRLEVVRAFPNPGFTDRSHQQETKQIEPAFALLPDGSLVVANSTVSDWIIFPEEPLLNRRRPDGSVEPGFSLEFLLKNNERHDLESANAARIFGVVPEPSGSLLVFGEFLQVQGLPRCNLARIRADGRVDPGFDPAPYGLVQVLHPMPGQRWLAGGSFTGMAGQSASGLALLESDGTRVSAFSAGVSGGKVLALARQPDGRILVGGDFTHVNGLPRARLARLWPDGSLDVAFQPEPNATVTNLLIQPDGRILVAGSFCAIGGGSRCRLARLLDNGVLDPEFAPGKPDSTVLGLALTVDGNLFVHGEFTSLGGTNSLYLARLNARGGWSAPFVPSSYGVVQGMVSTLDGSLLARRTSELMHRLTNDPATNLLQRVGDHRVEWLRGGSAPEVDNVDFWLVPDGGQPEVQLGAGQRMPGGWFVDGLNLPSSGRVEVRALSAFGSPALARYAQHMVFGRPPFATLDVSHAGVFLANGATQQVSGATLHTVTRIDFALHSTGESEVGPILASLAGPDASAFAVSLPPPASLPGPHGLTWMSLSLLPSRSGLHEAELRILSADSDTPELIIHLRAWATAPLLQLETESGDPVLSGSILSFPPTKSGALTTLTLLLHNRGDAPSTLELPLVQNTAGTDFLLEETVDMPVQGPNGQTRVSLRFQPGNMTGPRTGKLTWYLQGPDQPPFTLDLAGTSLSAPDAWRLEQFGSTHQVGRTEFVSDPDGDGRTNFEEYALGSNPNVADVTPLVQASLSQGWLEYRFPRPPGLSGVVFGAEYSPSLPGTLWTPVLNTGSGLEQLFQVPVSGRDQGYLRLTTLPYP